jgi:hypothetical protein
MLLLRKIFLEDFWLKLFSFAVAVWIWTTVHLALGSSASTRKLEDLPVLVLSPASKVGEVKVLPDRVSVILHGRSTVLDNLRPAEIHPMVDLTTKEAQARRWHRVVVSAPPGITAKDVQPDTVEITIFPANP